MSRIRVYARNLLANYAGYAANLAVMFFLSPFVVHTLDKSAYGVWTLLTSLTGYLGLADMGVRGGLGRYLNHYLAKQDIPRANGIFNAAIVFFLACGAILAAASGALNLGFGHLFSKVPAAMIAPTQTAIWLIALNLWLSFFSAAFVQVLTAFERFELSNAIDLLALAIRTSGTVWVLSRGGGLVQLAQVQVVSTLAAVFLSGLLAKRVFPDLQFAPRRIHREQFRELFGFSLWSFVGGIASQLLYWTDYIVVGAVFGPESVTYYAIGGMLIIYGRGLLQQCAAILFPQVVQQCATRNWPALRSLVTHGSTLMMALGIVILVGMLVFGRDFIVLWMGPEYERSYAILAILAISQFAPVAASIGTHVFAGLNRPRLAALLTLLQGLLNLGLTLVLVLPVKMGLEGVAWGTFYPRVAFALLCGYLVLRWIGLPVRSFLKEIASRWAAVTVLFTVICLALSAIPLRLSWPHFLIKATLAVLAYVPLAWALMLDKSVRTSWQAQLLARFRKASA